MLPNDQNIARDRWGTLIFALFEAMQHLRLDQAIQNSPLGNPWKSYPQNRKNGTPYPPEN